MDELGNFIAFSGLWVFSCLAKGKIGYLVIGQTCVLFQVLCRLRQSYIDTEK